MCQEHKNLPLKKGLPPTLTQWNANERQVVNHSSLDDCKWN